MLRRNDYASPRAERVRLSKGASVRRPRITRELVACREIRAEKTDCARSLTSQQPSHSHHPSFEDKLHNAKGHSVAAFSCSVELSRRRALTTTCTFWT